MQIIIPKPSEKSLEKNGWREYATNHYYKTINNIDVCIFPSINGSTCDCILSPGVENPTPDDLIAIGNELKKLEVEE